jgi:hypothetical protein
MEPGAELLAADPDRFCRGAEGADDESAALLAETCAAPRSPALGEGVVIGAFAGWSDLGEPLVGYAGNPCSGPVAARSVAPLERLTDGCEVALTFIEGDAGRPLIVGVLQPSALELALGARQAVAADVDGERLELTAAKEIVLRCGEASITLTKAGKILLKGTYLLSRSSGVNRIKGGSVQIN